MTTYDGCLVGVLTWSILHKQEYGCAKIFRALEIVAQYKQWLETKH